MRAPAALALAALVATAPHHAAASDSSLACDRGLVSVGDTKLDLLGKCGPPALREAREEARGELELGASSAGGFRVSAVVERWTYDFGPRRFTYVVTLEGGRVVLIERGGYGYERDGVRARAGVAIATCESSALQEGATKLDLLARCGEPAAIDRRKVERAVASSVGGRTVLSTRTAEVEVWSYNFGPRRFMHLVTIEDGKVIGVERAGYGYDGPRGAPGAAGRP